MPRISPQRIARATALANWLGAGNTMPERVHGQHTFPGGRTVFADARGNLFLDADRTMQLFATLGCGGGRYPGVHVPAEVAGPFAPSRWNQHTLVALCHLETPEDLDMTSVDHVDGNRYDCAPSNLVWVTQAENNRRALGRRALLGREGVRAENDQKRAEWLARAATEGCVRADARARIRAHVQALRQAAA